MKELFRRIMRRIAVDHPSPLRKQSATVIALAVAVLIVVLVPGIDFTNKLTATVGIAVVAMATIVAALANKVPRFSRYVMMIPAMDILAIGAFRDGTGGTVSFFGSLIILPVVWLAAAEGRRHIVYAGVGTSVALMFPYILSVTIPQTPAEWMRGVFTPLVFGTAAAIINELARQSRAQMRALKQMTHDQEAILQRTFEYAADLQESEAKFRGADRMFRGVWAAVTEQSVIGTDDTGLIDAWNPGATKILGPTASDAEDKMHIFDFHLEEELDARAKELNYPPGATVLNPGFSALVEAARLGEAEVREWSYRRSDGTIVPVQLAVTARRDEEGAISGYLFVATDETKNREVSKLKDEFVGLISHELRTPLSSILGYLELMRDDDQNPLSAEHLQYLKVAERNAHRLLRLVGDLLFTAQVESGKFPLDARDVDLERIVAGSVESAAPVASAAGIILMHEPVANSPVVFGDPVRLGQAVDNLISNAIKFTPNGGTVTVAVSATATVALITVRDTGIGIAASELTQLFGRFFRATTATRNAVPGVGLGLTITKAIVTAHHGEMDVESEEGVGTCFSVTLPLALAGVVAVA